jgi:hypothetical protein
LPARPRLIPIKTCRGKADQISIKGYPPCPKLTGAHLLRSNPSPMIARSVTPAAIH